ncbi:MAG: discoidin domain-containing protein [Actinomycetia bacterium]|nr:discoidin domain-containing protein [Actinomycetes bacterium]
MSPDHDPPNDHGWDNRRLILASLAPRTTTRPARKTPAADDPDDNESNTTKRPSLLGRALRACARTAAAAGRAVNKRVPTEHRTRALILTAVVVVALAVALAGVKHFSADINPPPPATTAAPPPAPSQPPLRRDTVLTGVTATDLCPRDANYSDANRAFDGDSNTAWICTRANNQDGQTLQVDFGRQVTLTQIRAIGGFDALAPDGTDQWPQHRIVTKLEIWFPKELKRDPVTINTNGVRGFRFVNLNPPATVNKLLIRVAETSPPPRPSTPTPNTPSPATDEDATTVAISEIQFIGTESPRPT